MSTIVGAADSPIQKLPLWSTIRLSYATYFQHFGDALRISALWLPLIAVLAAMAGWLQASLLVEMMAKPQLEMDVSQPVHMLILGYGEHLVLACAAISSAVAWHRLLLINEAPSLSGSNFGTRSLWRYVGIGIVIVLIAALPVAGVLLPMSLLGLLPAAGRPPPGSIAVVVVAYVVGIALMLRFCLLLPARAAGDLNLTFKDSWRHTRGNAWRIFWGIAACAVPSFLLTDLIFFGAILVPLGGDLYLAQWAAATAIALCCWLLTWPIWVGFLSHTYRHLVSAA
jgi:hypothetical protein